MALFTLSPILSLHVQGLGIKVYFYSYYVGLGCLFMGQGRFIEYASEKMKIHGKNYHIHDLEVVVVVSY
ncbi:hypothetical protein MTR67_048116 [Solanum verrucosum]|uniref:Uncharacterized protein n=1 Tax=Solanum verrucosum TaxID=315347 RepID=A0AAF0V108_SOLVR|nr:hypothetical protein MTR67_048116 [Solanum verrucosum]